MLTDTMKTESFALIFCMFLPGVYAQQPDQAEPFGLTIRHVEAPAFPSVSVSFKAAYTNGAPVRNLRPQQITVYENGKPCQVRSLRSDGKPVSLSIVIDRSSSMEEDPAQLYDAHGQPLFTVDKDNNMIVSETYTSPLDHAKQAIGRFISGFDLGKDVVSITSFSSSPDQPLPLTHSRSAIHRTLSALVPEGKTALYDGMLAGLCELDKARGIRVLVVLTDGSDNRSAHHAGDVISKARQQDIPVYIIGLGKVNAEQLQEIADQTSGRFYQVSSSASLHTVYSAISKQISHGYTLEYSSPDTTATQAQKTIRIVAGSGKDHAEISYVLTQPVSAVIATVPVDTTTNTTPVTAASIAPATADESKDPRLLRFVLAGMIATGVLLMRHRNRSRRTEAA
jgi:VWFA-related protein